MIADWKLEMMAKMIFEQIWQERKETVDTVCKLIKECYQVEKPKKVNLTGIVAQIERYKNKKNTLLEMRTDGEISKEEYKEQKEKIEKALLELTEEYERMLATEDAIQNPDICWDEIQSSLDAMIDFSNPQIDRHIIRKFVSKIVPNGRNHFRWYMNLDGKDTTTLDMVTEGRKNNAVISFNDDEEDEPPLHIGDVIGLTELQQYFPNLLKNENQNGIITTVGKCGKKSSLDAILHRQRLLTILNVSTGNSKAMSFVEGGNNSKLQKKSSHCGLFFVHFTPNFTTVLSDDKLGIIILPVE